MGRRTVVAIVALIAALMLPGAASAAVGITSFSAKPEANGGPADCSGAVSAPAGGFRDFCLKFAFDTSSDDVRQLVIDLPPGVVGDPTATPLCDEAQFRADSCPGNTQVGTASSDVSVGGFPQTANGAVYNVAPTNTEPARLGIVLVVTDPLGIAPVSKTFVESSVSVRVPDAGLRSTTTDDVPNSAFGVPLHVNGMTLDLWGNSHGLAKPFMSLPTRCDVPATATVTVVGYSGQRTSHTTSGSETFTPQNCDKVPFTPSLVVGPKTPDADTPGAASATLLIPGGNQMVGGELLHQSYLRDVALQLPAGLAINPPMSAGLMPCTDEQFAATVNATPQCPASSEIGTVSFSTPIFAKPLTGKVYFGQPQPGQLLRNFVSVEDPRLRVKLVGDVTVDPNTGAVLNVFRDSPQVPFTAFQFTYNGGDRAVLTSPTTCDTFNVVATMTPWIGAFATQSPLDTFTTVNCPPPAFFPVIGASSSSQTAGGNTALTVHITRPDRQLRIKQITTSLPPGLTGRLTAVPACKLSDARAAACPDSSQVGSVQVAVGTGPQPLSLPGKVYLADGFNGSIASLAIVVPARVPALDLGTVVTMARLNVRQDTGIDVVTDDLPQRIQGIPIDYRSIDLTIDKPGFMINPTSCDPLVIHADFQSVTGPTAAAETTYQATGCDKLPFAPKLTAAIGAPGEDGVGGHPPLTVTITQADGEAAMKKTVVQLPAGMGVDLKNLKAACSDDQLTSGQCPAASRLGTVTADTPLLPNALSGGAYLMQPQGGGLPGIALDLGLTRLKGAVTLTPQGRLQTTFDNIPDVPLRRLVLALSGGKTAVLTTSSDLCSSTPSVDASFGAQSGAGLNAQIPATVSGCTPLKATGKLTGVRKHRPALTLNVQSSSALKELRVKLPKQLKLRSSSALRSRGRFALDGKRRRDAVLRAVRGQLRFKVPATTSKVLQVKLPAGVLRLHGKLRVGQKVKLVVSGIDAAGKVRSATVKLKAGR